MNELFVYPEVAVEIIKKNSPDTTIESMSYKDLGEALSRLSNHPELKYIVTELPYSKDENRYVGNVISFAEEFPIKIVPPLEKNADGKVITYISSEMASEVIRAGVHSLTDEQKAIILGFFPQSKYRSYKIGPIAIDEDEAYELGNYILSTEDFICSNYRNDEECEYFQNKK